MGGADGFHSIYLSLRGSLARAVAGIVPPKEIEDIVQETYVRACQIEKTGEIRTPRSFLLKTARNLALDHVKRAESRLTDSLEDSTELGLGKPGGLVDETFEEVASNEEFALFCDAVRHLPLQCRRAFVLKKVYGYSRREIAKEMRLSESTVQTQLARGMKRCTYFMDQYEKENQRGVQVEKTDGQRNTVTSPQEPKL